MPLGKIRERSCYIRLRKIQLLRQKLEGHIPTGRLLSEGSAARGWGRATVHFLLGSLAAPGSAGVGATAVPFC